jgi:RNA polymerase sigma factor (sigma-70 family)
MHQLNRGLFRRLCRLSKATKVSSDAVLLSRFAAERDGEAFRELVERHGPMVFRTCRRVLHDVHAAEDAFQAVFVVLSRRAGELRRPEALAGWLHGVALRVASEARRSQSRHPATGQVDQLSPIDPRPDPLAEISARDFLSVLDEELQRLPEVYRLPLVLCCLEGRSQDEAAMLLGWTAGSVKGRLERGRARLQQRLARRGTALSAALLIAQGAASAGPTCLLLEAAAGLSTAAVATLSPRIAAWAQAAARAHFDIKALVCIFLSLSVVLGGLGLALAAKKAAPEAAPPPVAGAPGPVRPALDRYGDALPEGAITRLGSKRWRSRGGLYSMAWRPDGKAVAVGTSSSDLDSRILVWDAEGRLLSESPGHAHVVRSLAWSADGRKLVSTGGDGGLRIWEGGREVLTLPMKDKGFDGAIFLRGDKAVAVLEGPNLVVLDASDGHRLRQLPAPARWPRCLTASGDGKFLASCSQDGIVRLWDTGEWKELWSAQLSKDYGLGLAFSADNRVLAGGTFAGGILGWDVATGKELFRGQSSEEAFRSVAVTPDAKALVLAGDKVRVWDLAGRKEVRHMEHGAQVMQAAISPDGKKIASIGGHGAMRLWDLATGAEVFTLEGHYHPVRSIAFSPDGKVVVTASDGTPVRAWDAQTGRLLRGLPECSGATQVGFLPRSRVLVTASFEQHLELWDMDKGTRLRSVRGPAGPPFPFAITADGRTLAGSSSDGRVRLFDVATREVRGKDFPAPPNLIGSTIKLCGEDFALSADGSLLATRNTAMGDDVTVWETATQKERLRVASKGRPMCFSPDGGLLAMMVDSEVRLHDIKTGHAVQKLPCAPWSQATVFSPDGKVLAVGTGNGLVVVWEVATGQERCRFIGHDGGIECIAFAPDCRRIASGGRDLTGLVWDLASEKSSVTNLEALWLALRSSDAAEAHRALWALVERPETVELLARQMALVRAADKEKILSLIKDLDDDSYAKREAAEAALARLGEAALPGLRQASKDKALPPEPRRRLDRLLGQLESWRRELRAVEVLERIGSPAAQSVLKEWAGGLPEALLTREAKAALARCRDASSTPTRR